MENELVSIVVPVYNVEKYLEKCLDSIVNQTYKNIEIICVDDGSPDNSIEILKEYSKNDNRIKIIRQENQGLSQARNTGIENATGKYITFVDSDDWIELNMIELMVNKIEKEKMDIVICGRNNIINKKVKEMRIDKIKEVLNNRILNGIEYFKLITSRTSLFTAAAYNKLYLTKIIKEKDIIFPVGKLHEDLLFVFKYLYFSSKVGIVEDNLYNYVVSREGAITSKINKNDIDDTLYTLKELKTFLKTEGNYQLLNSKEFSEYMFLWISRAVLFKLPSNEKKYGKKEINRIINRLKEQEEYKDICINVLENTNNKKNKLFIRTLYLNNSLFKILLKINLLKNKVKNLYRS